MEKSGGTHFHLKSVVRLPSLSDQQPPQRTKPTHLPDLVTSSPYSQSMSLMLPAYGTKRTDVRNSTYNQQAISPAQPMASPNAAVKQEYYAPATQQQTVAPAQSQFQTAVPLQSLQDQPAPVDCPICHTRAMTRVEAVSGNTTQ